MGARGRAPRRVITEVGAVWGRGPRFRTSSISELPTGRRDPPRECERGPAELRGGRGRRVVSLGG